MTKLAQIDSDPGEEPQRFFTFSERKLIEETGGLGALAQDSFPSEMAPALESVMVVAVSWPDNGDDDSLPGFLGDEWDRALWEDCFERYGSRSWYELYSRAIRHNAVLRVLDLIELVFHHARLFSSSQTDNLDEGTEEAVDALLDGCAARLNRLFELHRVGYRIVGGRIMPIVSPLLAHEVVGPGLVAAVTRPSWHHVESAYGSALSDLRANDPSAAVTNAVAAVEAALKALGLRGRKLSDLLKALRGAEWIPNHDAETVAKLIDRMMAWRSLGDAHGKSPDAGEASPAVARLAVHWAGAVIVYLDEIGPNGGDS